MDSFTLLLILVLFWPVLALTTLIAIGVRGYKSSRRKPIGDIKLLFTGIGGMAMATVLTIMLVAAWTTGELHGKRTVTTLAHEPGKFLCGFAFLGIVDLAFLIMGVVGVFDLSVKGDDATGP